MASAFSKDTACAALLTVFCLLAGDTRQTPPDVYTRAQGAYWWGQNLRIFVGQGRSMAQIQDTYTSHLKRFAKQPEKYRDYVLGMACVHQVFISPSIIPPGALAEEAVDNVIQRCSWPTRKRQYGI